MSAAPPTAAPGHPARGRVRALVLVLALLFAPLAAAPAFAAAPPPAAVVSAEAGELQHDIPEAALRLPTGHPTRLPAGPRRRPAPATPPRSGAAGPGGRPSHRALRTLVLRTVVLRC
ncbi:hypothetical protein [Streptomyces sp. NPDC006552]|uniref:hypothetical protein n=1 Tax=Streptomyces sp. NPDC006552 TaxID=3157179 RepID=UPI0033BDA190